jgi:protoheme IX farnesyltransferase
VEPKEAFLLGLLLAASGVGWALLIDPLYGVVVAAGLVFDVGVYTLWLKRRTAWSIIWGGIAGGMPVLAGRALGLGSVDWIGLALCLGVLFWIPTHIMTFSMRFHADYQRAGLPTFPQRYGYRFTRIVIAISSVLAALAMAAALVGIGCETGPLILLGLFSFVLFILAMRSMLRPSERLNYGLFKYASVYMMGAMLLLVVTGI